MRLDKIHDEGPGLRVVSGERWYGPGYCGICGDRGPTLVARAVRYWDADDGWRMGVLCVHCGMEAAARGPRPDDYAVVTRRASDRQEQADMIDVEAGDDADAAYSSQGGAWLPPASGAAAAPLMSPSRAKRERKGWMA